MFTLVRGSHVCVCPPRVKIGWGDGTINTVGSTCFSTVVEDQINQAPGYGDVTVKEEWGVGGCWEVGWGDRNVRLCVLPRGLGTIVRVGRKVWVLDSTGVVKFGRGRRIASNCEGVGTRDDEVLEAAFGGVEGKRDVKRAYKEGKGNFTWEHGSVINVEDGRVRDFVNDLGGLVRRKVVGYVSIAFQGRHVGIAYVNEGGVCVCMEGGGVVEYEGRGRKFWTVGDEGSEVRERERSA